MYHLDYNQSYGKNLSILKASLFLPSTPKPWLFSSGKSFALLQLSQLGHLCFFITKQQQQRGRCVRLFSSLSGQAQQSKAVANILLLHKSRSDDDIVIFRERAWATSNLCNLEFRSFSSWIRRIVLMCVTKNVTDICQTFAHLLMTLLLEIWGGKTHEKICDTWLLKVIKAFVDRPKTL